MHIEGWLKTDSYGVTLNSQGSLVEQIALELQKNDRTYKSKLDTDNNNIQVDASVFIPRVSLRAYFSDRQCSLEKAKNNQILLSIGALDIFQEWYGYSEYTIMGYDVENFKLVSEDGGEHDLENIFENYKGKYVHIVIDILE